MRALIPLLHDQLVVFFRDLPHGLATGMAGPHLLVCDEFQSRNEWPEFNRGVKDLDRLEFYPEWKDLVAKVWWICEYSGCVFVHPGGDFKGPSVVA